MSADFERLVGRAVLDKDFRDRLLADPQTVIKDENLQLEPDELARVEDAARQIAADPDRQEQLDQNYDTAKIDFWK